MSESRSDSLAARLKRADLFDEYFAWWLQERPSFACRLEWLEKHGCTGTAGALHRLHRSSEAAQWRMAEAAKARAVMDANLPPDIDITIRKALLDQRFNAAMGELSHKELMDHLSIETETEKLKLKERALNQKDQDLALAERRVEMLEANATQAKAALEGIKSKGGLTPETLRQIEEAAKLL
jgi:hypothetical protein